VLMCSCFTFIFPDCLFLISYPYFIPIFYFLKLYIFLLLKGASKNLNLMEWDKLWTINKKIIDPVCARHTAVLKDQRVIFTLTNGPEEPFVRILPRHKKFEGAGKKATTFANRIWLDYADAAAISKGEEVTLMDWGNAIVKEIKVESGVITELVGELHLEGSVKTTKLKITWLADIEELVPLSLVEFDYLISKKKVIVCSLYRLLMLCTSAVMPKYTILCMSVHVFC
jgi:glutamyl-tRNA synthetase